MAGIPGHATLVRAQRGGASARWGVFHPEPPAVAALAAGLRARFDPRGVLNPGRMAATAVARPECRRTSPPSSSRDPATARPNRILRTCVHCGFCTATCPTYQVLGDELDSPRGPHLPDQGHARGRAAGRREDRQAHRPLPVLPRLHDDLPVGRALHAPGRPRARLYRADLPPAAAGAGAARGRWRGSCPIPARFRAGAGRARVLGRPFAGLMPRAAAARCWRSRRARCRRRDGLDAPQVFPAEGARRKRVALLAGCAQRVLDPRINAATIRLLTRHGCEVVVAEGAGCCGALTHHMGKERESHAAAAANIRAWMREANGGGLDAIVVNTSGCGTTVKDYGHMFERRPARRRRGDGGRPGARRHRADGRARPRRPAAPSRCASPTTPPARCSTASRCASRRRRCCAPRASRWSSRAMPTSAAARPAPTTCCSRRSRRSCATRKVATLEERAPQVIAAGNIGCMMQIGAGDRDPGGAYRRAPRLGDRRAAAARRWPGPDRRRGAGSRPSCCWRPRQGPQERRPLGDEEGRAFLAVGRLNVAGRRFCTATLIEPAVIVTAAHCLFHPRTRARVPLAEFRFAAGYRRGEAVGAGTAGARGRASRLRL